MSSTNRGYERHKSDYYITPKNEIVKFLDRYTKYGSDSLFVRDNVTIFDPCSGGDKKHAPSYPCAINTYLTNLNNYYKIITNDIREDSVSDFKEDYLDMDVNFKPDIIITNPPFNISFDIVKKALNDINDGGVVIMLLRLNYFGSKQRNEWLRNNMPESCYIHGKRMSFTEDGKTDSIEYAHFVWRKGMNPEYTRTYLLEF